MIHTFQIVCALESIINHVLSREHTQKDTIITISLSKNVKHANRGKQKTRRMSVLYSAMSCVICDNDRKGCEEIDISKNDYEFFLETKKHFLIRHNNTCFDWVDDKHNKSFSICYYT